MPTAIREQVVAAFEALLDGSADLSGIPIERMRDVDVVDYPSLVIAAAPEAPIRELVGRLNMSMSVSVQGFAEAATGEALDAAITDLYAKVVKAVLSGDRQLGGIADDIRLTEMEPDYASEAADRRGRFVASFEVDYWINPTDPFTQSSSG